MKIKKIQRTDMATIVYMENGDSYQVADSGHVSYNGQPAGHNISEGIVKFLQEKANLAHASTKSWRE